MVFGARKRRQMFLLVLTSMEKTHCSVQVARINRLLIKHRCREWIDSDTVLIAQSNALVGGGDWYYSIVA